VRSVHVTHVPKHVRIELLPAQADALGALLKAVVADEGFPLNEMEDEVVSGLLDQLDDEGEQSYTR
jgi:hypothetical protein